MKKFEDTKQWRYEQRLKEDGFLRRYIWIHATEEKEFLDFYEKLKSKRKKIK